MNAKEIRIGNWVLVDDGQTLHQWDLKDYDAYMKPIGDSWENDKVQPIPLTPEILEKCGFEEEGLVWDYELQEIGLIKWDDGYRFADSSGYCPFPSIQYLHQLQNLYFALTGSELEVNL